MPEALQADTPAGGADPAAGFGRLAVLGVGLLALVAVVIATPALRGVAELLWVKLRLLLGGSV